MKRLLTYLLLILPLLSNGQFIPVNKLGVSASTFKNQPQPIDMSGIRFIRAPYSGTQYFDFTATRDFIVNIDWTKNKWLGISMNKNSVSLGLDVGSQSFNYSYTFNDGVTENLKVRSANYNLKLIYNYTLLNTKKSELWLRAGIAYIKYMEARSSLTHNEFIFSGNISGSNRLVTTGDIRTPIGLAYQYKISNKTALFLGIQTYLMDIYDDIRDNEESWGAYGDTDIRYGGFRVYNTQLNKEEAYGPMHVKNVMGGTRLTLGLTVSLNSLKRTHSPTL